MGKSPCMGNHSAHLGHLHRKKKLRCSSRRRADSGRLMSMYDMFTSAPSCGFSICTVLVCADLAHRWLSSLALDGTFAFLQPAGTIAAPYDEIAYTVKFACPAMAMHLNGALCDDAGVPLLPHNQAVWVAGVIEHGCCDEELPANELVRPLQAHGLLRLAALTVARGIAHLSRE